MNIIIIGATSGIGKALAEFYLSTGHRVGITGRRSEILNEIKRQYSPKKTFTQTMDITNTEKSRKQLADLVRQMGGELDILIVNAGVGFPKATYEEELLTVDTNVRGFMALANWGFDYFKSRGKGSLAGISSVAAVRSSPYAPEYHASKAFVSSYLEGLHLRTLKWHPEIHVIDIRPGFVATPMTEQNKGMFWVASPEKAARQIADAIALGKPVAYITRRYVLVAWLMRLLPEVIYAKIL